TEESDGIVSVLRDAARYARARGAPDGAIAYLRRALAEHPPAADRPALLLELGSSEALVSGEAAVEHLREAHRLLDDPVRRAETAILLGRQLYYLVRIDESVEGLDAALDELGGVDPELERILEAALISTAMFEPSLYAEAARRLQRVRAFPAADTPGERTLLALLAFEEARSGSSAADAVPL